MALACDVLVASDNARFALPEVKVGHAALGGGILRLTRAIGHHRAMSMILTGRSIDAHEAFALGLVSEVSAPEALMARALFWAELICANGPRASKRVATSCTELPLKRAVKDQWNVAAVERLLASDESSEGVAAFLEKRAPAWR